VLYGTFGGCRIHHLGDAIESFNRASLSPERGLSLVRGRLLDDPEMTENKVAPIPDLMKMATIALALWSCSQPRQIRIALIAGMSEKTLPCKFKTAIGLPTRMSDEMPFAAI
jgi:hypothetical protein